MRLPCPSTQGKLGGKLQPRERRKVLRFARIIFIKAPSLDFIIEMVAVKQFSSAADVVAVSLEEFGEQHGIVEDGIVSQRTLVDVIA